MSPQVSHQNGDVTAGSGRAAYLWSLIWMLWLPFFIPVMATFLRERPATPRLLVSLVSSSVFFALYIWMARRNALRLASPVPVDPPAGTEAWVPVAAMVAIASGMILLNGQTLGALFIYTAACVGAWLPLRPAVGVILGLVAIAASSLLSGVGLGTFASSAAFITVPGLTVVATSRSVGTSQRLRAEREALARQAAVNEERLRIARDLHDLLGHDLAQIALKSEVAEYLVAGSPEQAAAAMREVADAARRALREVRAAVAGYRQPTLAGELRAAREILGAAGIEVAVVGDPSAVPASVEPVMAWAVREGVTNAVKHSHARHCTIRLAVDDQCVRLAILDDGYGDGGTPGAPRAGFDGSGLAGLSERLATLGGRVDAGAASGGGFSLSVFVPLGEPAPDGASPEAAVAHSA